MYDLILCLIKGYSIVVGHSDSLYYSESHCRVYMDYKCVCTSEQSYVLISKKSMSVVFDTPNERGVLVWRNPLPIELSKCEELKPIVIQRTIDWFRIYDIECKEVEEEITYADNIENRKCISRLFAES